MSTNYYLDYPHNEEGHIGKWAAGYFTAKAPEGVDSLDDWKAMLQGHRIFAEHGLEYTPADMISEIQPTSRRNIRRPHPDKGEWVEEGVLFVRYDFC